MQEQVPQPGEYSPHHMQYLSLIHGPVVEAFRAQRDGIRDLVRAVPEERASFRYAPGKWTIRDVIGHMADAERIHTFRAVTFGRGDAIEVPRYDPEGYVAGANFNERSVRSLVDELLSIREATIALFENMPSEAWSRGGTCTGRPLTVRSVAHIAAGHVQRHLNVLYEKYGVPRPETSTAP